MWQVTATEIEEPKKETEYLKAKKNWRNYILKKKKEQKKDRRLKKNKNQQGYTRNKKLKKKDCKKI